MVKQRWAPALATIVLAVASAACNDGGGIKDPPVAPTINLSPPAVEASPHQGQTPPPLPDWDRDSIAPSASTR